MLTAAQVCGVERGGNGGLSRSTATRKAGAHTHPRLVAPPRTLLVVGTALAVLLLGWKFVTLAFLAALLVRRFAGDERTTGGHPKMTAGRS